MHGRKNIKSESGLVPPVRMTQCRAKLALKCWSHVHLFGFLIPWFTDFMRVWALCCQTHQYILRELTKWWPVCRHGNSHFTCISFKEGPSLRREEE